MSAPIDPLTLALIAAPATYLWRFLGVALAHRLDYDGAVIEWIKFVANALVAALCFRLLLDPPLALADSHPLSRFVALAAAVGGFYAFRKRPAVGVACAVVAFCLAEAYVAPLLA